MPTSARVVAGGEAAVASADPAPRAPLAGPAQLDEPVARPASAGRPAARRRPPRPRPPPPARRSSAARVRLARSAARARTRAAGAAPRCARRRPARGPRRARCPRRGRARRAARRRGARRPAPRRTARARAGPVPRASASAPSTSTSASGFAAEPVSSRSTSDARAADPRARELEAEVAQRGGDRLAPRGRLGRGLAVEAAQHPVLEQHDPVVEVGRAAVGLAARRAGRQRQPGRAEEAHAGRGQRRVAALEVAPRHLGSRPRPRRVRWRSRVTTHCPRSSGPSSCDVEQRR